MQKEGLTQTRLNVILDSHQGLYEISQLLPHTPLRTIFTYWSVVHRTTCESGRTPSLVVPCVSLDGHFRTVNPFVVSM